MIDAPSSNPAPSAPQSPPFSPWWLFVFGVLVGYVVFRPGGVRDFFLTPGGFRDTIAVDHSADRAVVPPMPMQPQLGGAFGPGAGRRDNSGNERGAGGGAGWDDERDQAASGRGEGYSFGQEGFGDNSSQGERDREIRLPPTDLFNGSGGGRGGAPF